MAKFQDFQLVRWDADEGMVFDWKNLEEHQTVDEDGNIVVNHLYAKTLFIGSTNDSIENYIEVPTPSEE